MFDLRAFLAALGSILVGGVVATVTVISLVNAQTGADGESPADVNDPVVEYGTTE